MNLKTENTKNREMNDGGAKYVELFSIHGPGIHENCQEQSLGNLQQSQVQQIEQIVRAGYYRSRIPDYGPLMGGEAG